MRNWLYLFLVLLLGASAVLNAAEENGTAGKKYFDDFEKMDKLPDDWVVEGEVSLDTKTGSESEKSILFVRSEENRKVLTSLTTGAFDAVPGVWEISGEEMAKLYSPDSSFNGTVYIQTLDKDNKVLSRKELKIIERKHPWKIFQKNVEFPEGTVAARFKVTVNKTYGRFNIDNLKAKFLNPLPKTIFSSIRLAPKAYGGLFYPEDNGVVFDLKVICKKEWAEPVLNLSITDYWGAEILPVRKIKLVKGGGASSGAVYTGKLELSGQKLAPGKYHEIRANVTNGADDFYNEKSSFAIVPKAATKAYNPLEIPFTLNNWDDRMKDTFLMASRMGIPFKLVWSGWEAEPPYKTYAPGIQWIKEEKMGALLGTKPVHAIERETADSKKFTPEAIREGMKNLVNKYKNEMPIMIRCGNEPHITPETVKQNMVAYKAAYEGAKEADPNVIFIGTSIGPNEEIFKAGFGKYLDKYDFHTYGDWKNIRGIFANYEKMFEKYGDKKGIYCTEIGLNSQGMARVDVGRDMIKKFSVFFGEGGENLAWFDLLYPDPNGTITGSNGDSFNVFNCKYKLYSPRITAITYYNLVNGICIKKCVEEKIYDGEIEAFLFRDKNGDCMLVVWKEKGRDDKFIPLEGVGEVKAVRIDGEQTMLDAAGKGLTLTFDENPQLLFFKSKDMKLADKLQPAKVALKGAVPNVVMGSSRQLTFSTEGGKDAPISQAGRYSLIAPAGWKVAVDNTIAGTAAFTVTSPEKTTAETGMVSLVNSNKSTLLSIPMKVSNKVSLRVIPQTYAEGTPGVKVTVFNNSSTEQKVKYTIDVTQEIEMAKGSFSKAHGVAFEEKTSEKEQGELTLAAKTSKELVIPVENFNAKNIYQVRATAVDSDGTMVINQRYMGGFVGVKKIDKPLAMDLAADRAIWDQVKPQTLNEERQFYHLFKKRVEGWKGVDDLSAQIRYLWDEKYLYIKVDVIDDKYVHGKADGSLWNMDGLQMLVDPSREIAAKGGYYDIALGEGTKGSQVFIHSSADSSVRSGLAKDVVMKTYVTKDAGKPGRTYLVAMPWKKLAPFQPKVGNNIGMALIVNEDDGKGRGSFIGWFGCVHSKQLDLVGDLVLLGK